MSSVSLVNVSFNLVSYFLCWIVEVAHKNGIWIDPVFGANPPPSPS